MLLNLDHLLTAALAGVYMENAPHLEEDISFCARESVLEVVPRLVTLHESAAEIAL